MGNGPTNEEIAGVLERIADLLEAQDENDFRVRAYRRGADTVRKTDAQVADLTHQGRDELEKLPNVGEGIAGVIYEYVTTGRSGVLDRLRGEVSPREVIRQVPGIGPELADRVVKELDVDSLEALEQAAHDGRLEQVEGFGPKRARSVRLALAGMLSGAARRHARRVAADEAASEAPDVGTLLDVDREYLRKSEANELKKIAPKRFNPEKEAWLPILNTERGDWSFTALFSNTKQALSLIHI